MDNLFIILNFSYDKSLNKYTMKKLILGKLNIL